MTDPRETFRQAGDFHDAAAADLSGLGGILRCGQCQSVRPVGDIARYLRDGWPKCCGFTMTWVTAREQRG